MVLVRHEYLNIYTTYFYKLGIVILCGQGLKSSSSAAINLGVKLLLSVKNKKKSDFILQTA